MGDPCRNICSVWRPIWLDVLDAWYGTVHMRMQTVLARTIQVTDAKMMNGPCVCSLNVCVVAYSILAVVLRSLLLEFLPALIAFAYRHHGLL